MSSDEIVISVRNLTKTYRLFNHPGDRVKQFFSLGLKQYHREFTALNNVSFDIKKGETVGILGRNGSGKSTLLQLICGILKPSSGSVNVSGRVSALLELGAGFNPEFTGRENVYFQGALMGFTEAQMDERFDDIAAFADIAEFIDQPVRIYSSGMFVRLAFALAVHVAPGLLVVDEALAVGDIAFRSKCMKKMRHLIDDGCSLLIVSHDFSAIKTLCQKAIVLRDGQLENIGESGPICDDYVREQLTQFHVAANAKGPAPALRPPDAQGLASVLGVEVSPENMCWFGEQMSVRICYRAEAPLEELVVSFYIKDARHLDVLGSSSTYESLHIGPLEAGEVGVVEFCFRNPLRASSYEVTAILADTAFDSPTYYDWVDHACHFESQDQPNQPRWSIACPAIEARVLTPEKAAFLEEYLSGEPGQPYSGYKASAR